MNCACSSVMNRTKVYTGLGEIIHDSLRFLGANPAGAKHEKKEGIQIKELNKYNILHYFNVQF